MVNKDMLRGAYISKGYNTKNFAKKIGMKVPTFNRKANKGIFGSDEIEKMVEVLEIEEYKTMKSIFFASLVT